MFLIRVFCCLLMVVLIVGDVRITQAEPPADKQIKDALFDNLGDKIRFPGPEDCKAVVLLFVGYDCPISNAFAPEIVRICKEFAAQKIAFYVVYADADISQDEACKHAKAYNYPCPAVLDTEMKLARRVGATVKPEAAVLSLKGEILYLGRINDLYFDFGRKRPQPTKHDLKDALNAVLAGRPVLVPRTKAIGCYIDLPKTKD